MYYFICKILNQSTKLINLLDFVKFEGILFLFALSRIYYETTEKKPTVTYLIIIHSRVAN